MYIDRLHIIYHITRVRPTILLLYYDDTRRYIVCGLTSPWPWRRRLGGDGLGRRLGTALGNLGLHPPRLATIVHATSS